MDSTTTPSPPDHADIRLWLRLLFCASHIESTLQSKVNAEFGMTLARFDVLSQLERAPKGLTMTELSRRMMVSNGATTNLVDRLVEAGLIMRDAHPKDRRTTIIKLTGLGRQRFLEMAEIHEQWVIGLFAGLDNQIKQSLLGGLGSLKFHLEKMGI